MARAGWFAAGAAGAALAGTSTGWFAALTAGVALLVLSAAVAAARPRGGRSSAALALGVAFVAARMGLGSLVASPPAAVPDGEGPWQARVASIGSPRDGSQAATLELDRPGSPRVAATLPRYPEVVPGMRVEVVGSLEPPPEGGYGDWLRQTRVVATLRAAWVTTLPSQPDPGAALEAFRRETGRALAAALPEPTAGLAAGILVGLRDEVDRSVAAAFTTAGVSHVVAISGWNIAIVAATVGALLGRLRRRPRSIATMMAIVAYTAFAGGSPSVVRAAAMAGVVLLARESGRAGRAAAALGSAAGLLLIADPGLVHDAGFQLSVLATAGLLAWATPLRDRLDRVCRGRAPGWLLETLALSLAAQLATLPVVLASFGRLSLVAPLANLAIAPLVPPAMALGGLALIGGWAVALGAPAAIATVLGLPAWAVLALIVALVDSAASLPWASLDVATPWDAVGSASAALIAVALVPGVARRLARLAGQGLTGTRGGRGGRAVAPPSSPGDGRKRRRNVPWGGSSATRLTALLLSVAVAAVAIAAVHRSDGRVTVTVLDIGQGDAVLVEGDRGGRLLVDGGPDPDRLLVSLDGRLPPWDRRIDLVVLTHPHEDHVAGLPMLLDRYRVGRVFEPGMPGNGPSYQALIIALRAHGMTADRLATGDRLALDSIHLSVLWPDAAAVPAEPSDDGRVTNGASIVLLGVVGSGRFLLTGDIEDDIDPTLVARGLPHLDLLKVAHHGSRTATSPTFVDAVRPAIAIVSTGADNRYGHPAPETLERLEAVGARVFRTDLDGVIEATFDGLAWAVSTERNRASAPGRPLGYHRADGHPRAYLGRVDPALFRAAELAPAPLAGRRGDRRLARQAGRRARPDHRSPVGGGRGPAPRRRQVAALDRSCRSPPAWRRIRGLARPTGLAGARSGGRGPPCHTTVRGNRGRLAPARLARGAARRVRGQAGRSASRADGAAVRELGGSLPDGLGSRDLRGGATACRAPRGARLPAARHRTCRGSAAAVDSRGPSARCQGRGGRRVIADGAVLGFFSGDDGYGLERAVDGLARRLTEAAGGPPERRRLLGAAITLDQLVELVATAPLFGAGTLVTVVAPGPLVRSRSAQAALVDVIARVAPGNGLVFLDPLDGSAGGKRPASLDRLREAVVAAGGEARDLKAPREGQLAAWIEARARERGLQLERGAAQELGRRIGGSVREGDVDRSQMGLIAVGELEKLALYRPQGRIGADDVRALVPEAVPASSWAFLDAIGGRRVQVAADLLPRILETTPEPVLVAQLHRRLRELIEVADHLASGTPPASLVRTLGQKPYRVEKLVEQARRWTLPELEAALEGLLALDLRIKGVEPATDAQRRLAVTLWLAERIGGRSSIGGDGQRAVPSR